MQSRLLTEPLALAASGEPAGHGAIISACSTLGAVALWQLAYQHRLFDVGRSHALWVWPLLLRQASKQA